MNDKTTDESAPALPEPTKKEEDQLTDEQLDRVAGGGGRRVLDCEGFTYLSGQVLGTTATKTGLKSE